jgi:hypothetical protein
VRKSEDRIWDRYGNDISLAYPVTRFILPANHLALILPDTHAGVAVRKIHIISALAYGLHTGVSWRLCGTSTCLEHIKFHLQGSLGGVLSKVLGSPPGIQVSRNVRWKPTKTFKKLQCLLLSLPAVGAETRRSGSGRAGLAPGGRSHAASGPPSQGLESDAHLLNLAASSRVCVPALRCCCRFNESQWK